MPEWGGRERNQDFQDSQDFMGFFYRHLFKIRRFSGFYKIFPCARPAAQRIPTRQKSHEIPKILES
jgi:hypothetical protein